MKLQLDDDFGFAQVEITRGGQAGGEARLDLWEAFNTYAALRAKCAADAVALANGWVDWLASKGLPGLSHGAGFKVFDHIAATMQSLKKSETPPSSPNADSAGSTASPPST